MKKTDYNFKTIYWISDHSSEVNFQPISALPDKELVSSCFVFALHEDGVIMSRPERGWGLPGGHREGEETPEECVRREADEEASIELGDLRLIGRWEAKKKFHSPLNEKYPEIAYQLLYVADVTKVLPFKKEYETSERAIVPLPKVKEYHHNFDDFEEIFKYILDEKGLSEKVA